MQIVAVQLQREIPFEKKWLKYVSYERCRRIICYKNTEDKKRSLIAELLIKKIACQVLGIPMSKLIIKYGPYGKPYIQNNERFTFNISHSGMYVILIQGTKEIGIDIEQIKGSNLSIAERFFTYNEYKYIASCTSSCEKAAAFYQIWTLKESYVKAVGKGLAIPLNSFEFSVKHKNIIKHNLSEKYQFWNHQFSNYMVSVCSYEEVIDYKITYITEQELYAETELFLKQNF